MRDLVWCGAKDDSLSRRGLHLGMRSATSASGAHCRNVAFALTDGVGWTRHRTGRCPLKRPVPMSCTLSRGAAIRYHLSEWLNGGAGGNGGQVGRTATRH